MEVGLFYLTACLKEEIESMEKAGGVENLRHWSGCLGFLWGLPSFSFSSLISSVGDNGNFFWRKLIMKRLTIICIFVLMFVLSGIAVGDIPANVDYHAIWDGNAGAGAWNIPKNMYGFDDPVWQADHKNLLVDNQEFPDWIKHIWVEVEWISMLGMPAVPPDIRLGVAGSVVTFPPVPTASGMGWTWHWTVDPQPPCEFIQFPDTGYWHLGQIVNEQEPYYAGVDIVEIGTLCIPEPVTICLLGLGGLLLRRRKSA